MRGVSGDRQTERQSPTDRSLAMNHTDLTPAAMDGRESRGSTFGAKSGSRGSRPKVPGLGFGLESLEPGAYALSHGTHRVERTSAGTSRFMTRLSAKESHYRQAETGDTHPA